MEEINFFIVAPHWYFRAHMGLLTVCAQHYEGLAWLISFYALLCYLPLVHRAWNSAATQTQGKPGVGDVSSSVSKKQCGPTRGGQVGTRQSLVREALYLSFFSSVLFVG